MKTCSNCGHENPDDAARCLRCGEPLAAPSRPAREPRPEAHTVLLRTFSREADAQVAAERLRAASLSVLVAVDDCGGLLPPLAGGSEFRLLVTAHHREAAAAILAEMEPIPLGLAGGAGGEDDASVTPVRRRRSLDPSTTLLLLFSLGIAVGILAHIAYLRDRRGFSGTYERDLDHDRRTDVWDTYVNGKLAKEAMDRNGDEQPDEWYFYENEVVVRGEADDNFDGKVDAWFIYDGRGVIVTQSKLDVDFDGKPDVTTAYHFGLRTESRWTLPDSGLLWKKDLYTNGLLREEFIDHDRNGKFDEKIIYNVFGDVVKREKLE